MLSKMSLLRTPNFLVFKESVMSQREYLFFYPMCIVCFFSLGFIAGQCFELRPISSEPEVHMGGGMVPDAEVLEPIPPR